MYMDCVSGASLVAFSNALCEMIMINFVKSKIHYISCIDFILFYFIVTLTNICNIIKKRPKRIFICNVYAPFKKEKKKSRQQRLCPWLHVFCSNSTLSSTLKSFLGYSNTLDTPPCFGLPEGVVGKRTAVYSKSLIGNSKVRNTFGMKYSSVYKELRRKLFRFVFSSTPDFSHLEQNEIPSTVSFIYISSTQTKFLGYKSHNANQ